MEAFFNLFPAEYSQGREERERWLAEEMLDMKGE